MSLEEIYGTLAYYHRHQAEVDAYVERVNAVVEQLDQEHLAKGPSPAAIRIRALQEQRRKPTT